MISETTKEERGKIMLFAECRTLQAALVAVRTVRKFCSTHIRFTRGVILHVKMQLFMQK